MEALRFNKSHEWIRIEGNIAVMGISDYAQSQLGDVVFIELPKAGSTLEQSQQLGTIESTKTASEIYAPISGEVLEINLELVKNPEWINQSAQDKGWMVKLKIQDPNQLENLMDETAYKEFIEKIKN